MKTKSRKTAVKDENMFACNVADKLLKQLQRTTPAVPAAKGALIAAAGLARGLGVSRKMFLDTARKVFDGMGEE